MLQTLQRYVLPSCEQYERILMAELELPPPAPVEPVELAESLELERMGLLVGLPKRASGWSWKEAK